MYSESRFLDISPDASYPRQPYELAGYKWKLNGEWCFMFLPSAFQGLCKNAGAVLVKQEMKKRGWLALNIKGGILDTKHIPGKGKNERGVFVIPARWNEGPENGPSHVRTHAQGKNAAEYSVANVDAKAEATLKNQEFDDSSPLHKRLK